MASTDDINSTLKGTVSNMAQMANAFASPGRTAQTTSSPVPTIFTVTAVATSVITFNASRRAISFHNSNPTGTTIWVLPFAGIGFGSSGPVVALNVGVPIVPGGDFVIDTMLGSSSGWQAIAGSTTVLTILEFV